MKMNPDCIRDILLCIEEETWRNHPCWFLDEDLIDIAQLIGIFDDTPEYQNVLYRNYTYDILLEHLDLCFEAELIVPYDSPVDYRDRIWVSKLSLKGHEFLAHTRPQPMRDKIKIQLNQCGALTISTLVQLSATNAFGEALNILQAL